MSQEQQQRLEQEYRAVNPALLRAKVQASLERLWELAEATRPGPSLPKPGQPTASPNRGRRAGVAPPTPVFVGASAP